MRIAVLIVTRDRPVTLRRCLNSIFKQTYTDKEVHVLDDGSRNDGVESMLRGNFDEHAVSYYRVDDSIGATKGRNLLAARARGEILCFLDDDAYFENEDALVRVAAGFERHASMGVAAFKITDYRKKEPRPLLPFSRTALRLEPKLKDLAGRVSYYLGCGFAVRSEVFAAVEGFTAFLYYGEDELDFSYRVLEAGNEIRYLPEVQVAHIPGPPLLTNEGGRNKSYYHMRNRLYILYRYIPLPYALSYFFIWGSIRMYLALREGEIRSALRGFWAGLKQIPQWNREPLNPQTIGYLKENYGRLWY